MQSLGRESTTVYRYSAAKSKYDKSFNCFFAPQADLESTIKEKYQLEAQIEHFKDDIASLKETHADEVAS